eukprot:3864734-Pyramimonas_sp.AAC.1
MMLPWPRHGPLPPPWLGRRRRRTRRPTCTVSGRCGTIPSLMRRLLFFAGCAVSYGSTASRSARFVAHGQA